MNLASTGRALRLAATLVMFALVVSGCSRTGGRTESGGESRAPTTEGSNQADDSAGSRSSLVWQSCDFDQAFDCAELAVPMDWSDPSGEKIRLALGRAKATGKRIGSLLINPGGPGGSGLDLLGLDMGKISEGFDVVAWDPRGVGRSSPLSCARNVNTMLSLDPDPDDDAERAALDSAAEAVSRDCAEKDSALLAHMTTADTARDLNAIRVALGDEPLNYLGFSYGTHIGQTFAALFPDKVAKMVLDGVVDPAESFTQFLLAQTEAFEASLERQSQHCSEAGEKICGVKNLLEAFDKVRASAEVKPIQAGKSSVGPGEVIIAATSSAYAADGWRQLGPALSAALRGDGRQLLDLAKRYMDLADYAPYAAVMCSDGPVPQGTEAYRAFETQAERLSPRFGGSVANELLPCATWPVPPSEEPIPPIGDIPPILLVANTGDPATPFKNAERVHERIRGSVLIRVESDGHTAFGSDACVNRIVEDYLLRSKVPETGRTCR